MKTLEIQITDMMASELEKLAAQANVSVPEIVKSLVVEGVGRRIGPEFLLHLASKPIDEEAVVAKLLDRKGLPPEEDDRMPE